MAARSFWKGYLKLSLVTCPVAMAPAVSESEKLRFHTLNRATGHRVQARSVDAETGKPVPEEDEVKGYPIGTDQYVVLEDDEIAAVALDSTRTIDITTFAPKQSIGWIWYDTPHYLTPDDAVGEEAFCVIRDAMRATDTVGISRLVLYRRERAVMLEPRDRGIVLWTLRYGDEVRDAAPYFPKAKAEKVEKDPLSLVKTLIEQRRASWDPKLLDDPVQAKLLEIIAAKKKGKRATKPARAAARPSNVVNIMDALRRSIAEEKGR